MSKKLQVWPKKDIIIASQSNNVYMLLKELLRSVGWNVVKTSPSLAEVIESLRQKEAFVLIVDDSLEEPASQVIRQLLGELIGLTTPTFVFLLEEHKFEAKPLSQLGHVEVVHKPLTPSRFLPGFSALIKKWESKPYIALRASLYRYLETKDLNEFSQWLQKIYTIPEMRAVISAALAFTLIKQGHVQEAERILLQQLKIDPKNLSCILTLSDLYLAHAVPHIAKRLLLTAAKGFSYSYFLQPDIVQADFMLRQYPSALERLEEMRKADFLVDTVVPMMARIYFSQGRLKEAEFLMRDKKALFQKIKKSWEIIA